MTTNGETVKTKVIALDEINNFVVQTFFFIWIHLCSQNIIWSSRIFKLKNIQTTSNGETTPDEIWNLLVDFFV